jgi:glycolate oxidase iron-sulfur subunit
MQTTIHEEFRDDPRIEPAEAILGACVHCGFCNATCPTYLELGDERDGPRGRIYLIKEMLEGNPVTEATRRHLDRCLTCRNCETTCPSGVRYGELIDIGRGVVERKLERPLADRCKRRLLKAIVPYRRRFGFFLAIGQALRPLLPRTLKSKLPRHEANSRRPRTRHKRTMLVLDGCAQAAATPRTNAAAARVLDTLGIGLVAAPKAGCCGALSYHLGDHEAGRKFMRRNVDAWWPFIERDVEAIVTTASGCGATVKEYGRLLAADPRYAEKALRVSELARDLGQVLNHEDLSRLGMQSRPGKIAVHCPCTLQHAQRLPGLIERLLERRGFELARTEQGHLCCGSAGSYSLLEPTMSTRLRERKLRALMADEPSTIVTANIGCQLHLAAAARVPVKHWIELLDPAGETDSDQAAAASVSK